MPSRLRIGRYSRPLKYAGVIICLLVLRFLCLGAPSEYLIDTWDTEQGLPNSSVTAIAQTRDGYLWVGTYDGLARFDGVRFVPVNTPELGPARIQDLYVDGNGTLWINTYRGRLTSFRNGTFRREWPERGEFDSHTVLAASSSNEVLFVTQSGEVLRRTGLPGDPHATWSTFTPPNSARLLYGCADAFRTLWFMTRDGKITRFIAGKFQDLVTPSGLTGERVWTLVADTKGSVWAGTDKEVAVWDGHQFQAMTPTNSAANGEIRFLLPTTDGGAWALSGGRWRKVFCGQWTAEAPEWGALLGFASGRAMGMHEDSQGGVWLNHYGNGIFHITRTGEFQRFTTHEGLPGDRVWAWFEDAEQNVWLGVERGGLVRLREQQFQVIGPRAGLSARAVQTVCEDENGTMWFGTAGGGLCRWRDGQLETIPVGLDPSANFVFSVFPNIHGLWLSAAAGEDLHLFEGDRVQRAPWQVHGIKAMLQDASGRLWMGTKNGLSWWLPNRRRSFSSRDGMTVSAVRALAEAPDGHVWCGNDNGTLYQCEPDSIQSFRPTDALSGQPIWSLLAESNGVVWAGTFQGGLLRFKAGVFKRVTTDQGLPSDVISGILDDGRGQLWLSTHQGICRVDKQSLDACLDGRSHRLDCTTFGRLDGLPTLECGGNYQPACWRARDGRLWFATSKGIVSVKPAELKRSPALAPVVFEDFRVDGERVALNGQSLVLPPGRTQFEFRFTAPSFVAADKIRFRYKLEGLDADWVEADTRRVAQYSHLLARDYRFHVVSCNSDGQWNQPGAVLAFTLEPFFYQTRWFLALAGAVILCGVAGVVRAATTRKYRQALRRLEQQHAIERDRARIAKDIHDDLGAGLTQITLLSELARRDPADQAGAHLDHIAASARRLTRAMDEIVWAVDPQHDTLNGLMDYISAYTEDFLRTAGLRCRMDLPQVLPAAHVDAESRYHLFLALKETLNNIVKHAHATEVRLRLLVLPPRFMLVIEDDGRGLSASRLPVNGERLDSGHGLSNLGNRLAQVGGQCSVISTAGKGTRVEMTLRLDALPSPIMANGQNDTNGSE